MPSQKFRVIDLIKLFDYAPDEYQVHSILESSLNVKQDDDTFPNAATLSGKYSSDLKLTLELLTKKAADVELTRK